MKMMRSRHEIKSLLLSVILISISPSIARADSFGFWSDIDALKGQVIIDAGEVRKIDPPLNTEWREQIYELNGRCFTMFGYYGIWGYSGKAGLLLVNKEHLTHIAFLQTGIGSIDVKLHHVTLIHCPSGTNVIPYSDDPAERLKALERRRDELIEKLHRNQSGQ